MNIIKRAWLWLITKKENEVSEPIADTTVVTDDPTTVTADTTTVAATRAAEVMGADGQAATVQPIADSPASAGSPTLTSGTTAINETDAILSRLKKLVEASGAQAHAVIDDLIALAKKLG